MIRYIICTKRKRYTFENIDYAIIFWKTLAKTNPAVGIITENRKAVGAFDIHKRYFVQQKIPF